MEDLGDVKAASVAEWIGQDAVRRSIQKYFRSFLMTFLDEDGESMYGRKIQALGESESRVLGQMLTSQSTLNRSRCRSCSPVVTSLVSTPFWPAVMRTTYGCRT